MKKISILSLVLMLCFTSCDNYLDVNENKNKATNVTPDLVLPQALAATGLALNSYNTYGSQLVGYQANAGGYGGFNENVSYAFTPNNYNTGATSLWNMTYDNLEDYQFVINNTEGSDANVFYNAAAKIMRVYDFQMLVDTYNNIPYTNALKGADELTPAYDDAATIYASLATELDDAMSVINGGLAATTAPTSIAAYDIIFKGDMTKWLQLANTIKLRLMVRGNGKVTFSNTSFDPAGFLTTDALINPGYTRDNNRQNPKWNTWAFAYTGSAGNKAWIPSTYVMGFYNGAKLKDTGRGAKMYYQFPATGTNQLGYESTGIPKSPDGSFWYPGKNRDGKTAGDSTGVLKGPSMGMPMLTAAESYFLQAEAALNGMISGDPKALFNAGITASFTYLYTDESGAVTDDPAADAIAYIAANSTNYLANFDQATSNAQKLEAIITQKYIAMNMVNGQEGWNEYRRTGYPKVSGTAAGSTFASTVSQSSRADRLPSRILYPTSEIQYNPENVPSGISPFTSNIFWAK